MQNKVGFNTKKLFFILIILVFCLFGTFLKTKVSAINRWNEGYQIPGNGQKDVYIGGTSTCQRVTNTSPFDIFVPTKTAAEWSVFVAKKPAGITIRSCCTANSGQTCTSAANTCGQTNSGTYSCSGVCSASVPANPAVYGQACTSAANSCGQTNSGTKDCSGVCSASVPANPAVYGQACTSAANACGATNSGTINCSGACSASVPANPAVYGQACTSAANSCGQTNSGTKDCSGVCSASVPANPANYGAACTSAANNCGATNSGTINCSGACSASIPADQSLVKCRSCYTPIFYLFCVAGCGRDSACARACSTKYPDVCTISWRCSC